MKKDIEKIIEELTIKHKNLRKQLEEMQKESAIVFRQLNSAKREMQEITKEQNYNNDKKTKKEEFKNKLININHSLFLTDFYCTHSFVRLTKDHKYDDMIDVVRFNEKATHEDTINFISEMLFKCPKGSIDLILFFATNNLSKKEKIIEFSRIKNISKASVSIKVKKIEYAIESIMRDKTKQHLNFLSISNQPLK